MNIFFLNLENADYTAEFLHAAYNVKAQAYIYINSKTGKMWLVICGLI